MGVGEATGDVRIQILFPGWLRNIEERIAEAYVSNVGGQTVVGIKNVYPAMSILRNNLLTKEVEYAQVFVG